MGSTLVDTDGLFLKVYQFTFSPIMQESFNRSTSLPILDTVRLLNFSHPGGCVVVS